MAGFGKVSDPTPPRDAIGNEFFRMAKLAKFALQSCSSTMVLYRRSRPIRGAPPRVNRLSDRLSQSCIDGDEHALPGTGELLRCGAG